jgi:hypothetical protein
LVPKVTNEWQRFAPSFVCYCSAILSIFSRIDSWTRARMSEKPQKKAPVKVAIAQPE